jgi:hypothetical protein
MDLVCHLPVVKGSGLQDRRAHPPFFCCLGAEFFVCAFRRL